MTPVPAQVTDARRLLRAEPGTAPVLASRVDKPTRAPAPRTRASEALLLMRSCAFYTHISKLDKVVFVNEFPRTASRKIRNVELRERYRDLYY